MTFGVYRTVFLLLNDHQMKTKCPPDVQAWKIKRLNMLIGGLGALKLIMTHNKHNPNPLPWNISLSGMDILGQYRGRCYQNGKHVLQLID